MTDLKAWATRWLREHGLVEQDRKVWTKHGSTRYLFDLASIEKTADYVSRMQDHRSS